MPVAERKPVAIQEGTDPYGRYFEFTVGLVTQRLRWVEPGRFMMGSPPTERRRAEHETYHQVTLTRGFWLGDTTCTQLMFREIAGHNPAYFKGDCKPVEMVSWNDATRFIARLNELHEDLRLRLPSEAEWEYACRAGTQTPFSFGEDITPDQVNYNGNHPYGDGGKGRFRNQTVDVKSLPANPAGFYEMHGNTWEWCQDFYQSDLGTSPVTDPVGPADGEFRLMRGASWYDHAGTTRSASRNTGRLNLRIPFLGFRFARHA